MFDFITNVKSGSTVDVSHLNYILCGEKIIHVIYHRSDDKFAYCKTPCGYDVILPVNAKVKV